MCTQQITREVTVEMLMDLIGAHIWITQICDEIAEQSEIDEVIKTLRTMIEQYRSTTRVLQKLVNFVEDSATRSY